MKIYFIRHGESEANVLRVFSNRGLKHGLTKKGKKQARELVFELKDIMFHKIYCSPLLRAIETADIIAKDKGIQLDIEKPLAEFDCGVFEGRSDESSWDEFYSLVNKWLINKTWEISIEGGESFNDIKNRFLPFIENIKHQYGDSDYNIAMIGHGGTFLCVLPLILENIDFDFASKNFLSNTSYVAAEYVKDRFICTKWGDVEIY